MTEETKPGEEGIEGTPGSEGTPAEGATEGKDVTLSPSQYNAMLDALDDYEDLKTSLAGKGAAPTVDSLAAEGKETGPGGTAELPEQMENADLVAHILQEVGSKIAQPLLVKIEEIRVKDEIRELTRDGKNTDFWDFKEDIYKLAGRNPNLSIEEAYNLAKVNKGSSKESVEGDETHPLKHLPSRRTIPLGEKPGPTGTTVVDKTPETRAEAAEQAWDELEKDGKV